MLRKRTYACEVPEGSYFDFQPVRGDPKTFRFLVVKVPDEGKITVKEVDGDRVFGEQAFNEYAEVIPV